MECAHAWGTVETGIGTGDAARDAEACTAFRWVARELSRAMAARSRRERFDTSGK